MKLSELKITQDLKKVDSQPGITGHNLQEILARSGWHVLGYGAEAGVAEHPQRKYVLKIYPSNSLYQTWLNVVKQLSPNPHVPKISAESRTIPGTPFSYVRMEKLTRIEPWDLIHTYPQVLCLISKIMMKSPVWVRTNVSWDTDTNLINCNELTISDAETQVFEQLNHTTQTIGHRHLDLNHTNFMSRGNTWVITDPFI